MCFLGPDVAQLLSFLSLRSLSSSSLNWQHLPIKFLYDRVFIFVSFFYCIPSVRVFLSSYIMSEANRGIVAGALRLAPAVPIAIAKCRDANARIVTKYRIYIRVSIVTPDSLQDFHFVRYRLYFEFNLFAVIVNVIVSHLYTVN